MQKVKITLGGKVKLLFILLKTLRTFFAALTSRVGSLQNLIGLVLALVVIFGAFSVALPSFGTLANVENIARQSVIVSLAAVGMTFVIVVGGIDLSIGSTAALAGMVIAKLIGDENAPGYGPIIGAFAGVLTAGLIGTLNGVLITRLRVVPFIVTLGTFMSVRGLAKLVGNEQKIDAKRTWLNELLATLAKKDKWQLLPLGVWLTLLFAVAMALVLRYFKFGRHVVAVGSNEAAARLCGIPVEWTKVRVYAISGLFAGLAGLMNFSRLTVGDPTALTGLELNAIAAVVIGGASLSGGEGSIAGSILGAVILTVLQAGASQKGLPNYVQEIATGGIIVLAVWLDRIRKAKVASA